MTPKDFRKRLPDWPPLDVAAALRRNLEVQAALSVWMTDFVEGEVPLGVVPLDRLAEHAERVVSLVELTHPDIREVINVIAAQERQLRLLAGAHA